MPKEKTDNFHIRLPLGEKPAFRKAAERAGLDLTTWARIIMRQAAGLDVVSLMKKRVP